MLIMLNYNDLNIEKLPYLIKAYEPRENPSIGPFSTKSTTLNPMVKSDLVT